MPRFTYKGPDGRTVTLDGATEPTEQELDQIFSEMDTPAPDSGGLWDSVKDTGMAVAGRGLDVLGRVTGTLNRLGVGAAHAVDETVDTLQGEQSVGQGLSDFGGKIKDTITPTGVGKWKDNTDFNKVLENQGVEEYLKSVLGDTGGDWATAGLGFVGDVALDPLRIGAVNKAVGSGIKALAKAPGQAIEAALPHMPNVVQKGADKISTAASQAFVPEYQKFSHLQGPKSELNLSDTIRLYESGQRHVGEESTDIARELFKSKEKNFFGRAKEVPVDQRSAFAHAIDQGKAVPTGLEDQAQTWKSMMDDVWKEKQVMGSTTKILGPDGERLWDAPREVLSKEKNYVPYFTKSKTDAEAVVGNAFNTKTRTDKARQGYDTLEEAVRHGNAPDDAREILATALTMHGRAKRTQQFLSNVGQEFGQKAPAAGTRKLNREGFSVSDQLWMQLKDKHFPEDLAGYLERSVKLWEQPQELDKLWKTGTKLFKGAATSVNLPHHATNFLGNTMNMYTRGGMSMPEIAKQMVRSYGVLGKGKKMPKIGKYGSDELTTMAKEFEIIGTSGQLRDLTEAGTSEALTNNFIFQSMRRLGTEKVEEPARLALWFDGIEKGLSPAQSAIKVKNTLLDYAELTPFERQVRDYAIPFYTWARKNPVVQFEGLMMDPKKFANIGDAENVLWNAQEDQVNQSVIPQDWVDRGMVPGPLTGDNGELVMQRLGLPQKDLNKLSDPVGMVMEGLHPLLKMPMEYYMNQKTMGGPVQTPSGFTTPSPIASAVSGLIPDALEQQIPEALQGYANVANVAGRPRQQDVASWVMSQVPTGLVGQLTKQTIDDPKAVGIDDSKLAELLMRLGGFTPRVLTGEQQKFEMQDRKAEHRRKMSKVVMDR